MDITARIHAAAAYLLENVSLRPQVGLILGSGLGDYADTLEERVSIPFSRIPHFPVPTVPGHCGMRVAGVSCITNMAAGVLPQKLSHAEVMETAARVHDLFHSLVDVILFVV